MMYDIGIKRSGKNNMYVKYRIYSYRAGGSGLAAQVLARPVLVSCKNSMRII